MNVVSLELCKELYQVSSWEPTIRKNDTYPYDLDYVYLRDEDREYDLMNTVSLQQYRTYPDKIAGFSKWDIPAYDLGYLLRKLPPNFNTGDVRGAFEFFLKMTSREWFAGYNKPEMGKWLYDRNHGVWEHPCVADTPEDAACKLAIELFKQGILKAKDKEGTE